MVISDLNNLEVVTETASVLGGGKKYSWWNHKGQGGYKGKPTFVVTPGIRNKQTNVTVINQVQVVTAVAISIGGDATAVAAGGEQTADVGQDNTAVAA